VHSRKDDKNAKFSDNYADRSDLKDWKSFIVACSLSNHLSDTRTSVSFLSFFFYAHCLQDELQRLINFPRYLCHGEVLCGTYLLCWPWYISAEKKKIHFEIACCAKRQIFGEFINSRNSMKLIIMNGEHDHLIKIDNTKLGDLLLLF